MKKFALVPVIVAMLLGGLTTAISSEESDSLEVKVQPQLVLAVRIADEDSLVDFGMLLLSTDNDTRETDTSDAINVFNDGSSPVTLLIQGTDATTTTAGNQSWILDCSDPARGEVAVNQFVLRYAFGDNPDFASSGKALCTSGQNLATGVPPLTGEVPFVLEMNMPTGTTGFSERTSTVTITAVAE